MISVEELHIEGKSDERNSGVAMNVIGFEAPVMKSPYWITRPTQPESYLVFVHFGLICLTSLDQSVELKISPPRDMVHQTFLPYDLQQRW